MKNFIVTIISIVFCFSISNAQGFDTKFKLSIDGDSGLDINGSSKNMEFQKITARGLKRFADDISVFNMKTYKIFEDSLSKRSSNEYMKLLGYIIYSHMANAAHFTIHENGHWRIDRHKGDEAEFKKRSKNPYLFFMEELVSPSNGSDWGSTKFHNDYKYHSNHRSYFANGINGKIGMAENAMGWVEEIRYTGNIIDNIYYDNNKVHPIAFFDIMVMKLGMIGYINSYDDTTWNDPYNLSSAWAANGWAKTQKDGVNKMRSATILSTLFSSSTYTLANSFYNNFYNGSKHVKPVYWGDFRGVDVEAYFTEGVTYKVKSGYRVNNNLFIPFAVELPTSVGYDERKKEYSLGLKHKITNRLSYDVELISSEASQYSFEFKWAVSENASLYFGQEKNDIRNLKGLRDVSSFKMPGFSETDSYVGIEISF